jgi:hypothetical protein
LASQIGITRAVAPLPNIPIVLTAIHLNHQPCRIAREVDDQTIDRYLTPEMKSLAFEHAQTPPKLLLRFGLVAA